MPRKQPTHLTPKDVASHAYQWSRTELVEMKAIIDALLEACDPESEAKQEPVEGKQQWGKRGGAYFEDKVVNGCGPYRYLRYWQAGKRKSLYVGKAE